MLPVGILFSGSWKASIYDDVFELINVTEYDKDIKESHDHNCIVY